MRVARPALRYATFALVVLLLLTSRGSLNLSPVRELAAPHRYSLVQWELATFPEKWLYRLGLTLPGNALDRQAEEALVREFFELADRRRGIEEAIRDERAGSETGGLDSLRAQLAMVEADQAAIRSRAEEIMEGEIDSIVFREGLHVGGPLSAIGVHFPPVDFRIQASPPVTVVSPRDRIERLEDVLLRPDTAIEEREALEQAILRRARSVRACAAHRRSGHGPRGDLAQLLHARHAGDRGPRVDAPLPVLLSARPGVRQDRRAHDPQRDGGQHRRR